MRLSEYLTARGESQADFATRADVPQQTVSHVCLGGDCRISTAFKIVEASRRQPAPGGDTVRYEDLVPPLKKGASKKKGKKKGRKMNGRGTGPQATAAWVPA